MKMGKKIDILKKFKPKIELFLTRLNEKTQSLIVKVLKFILNLEVGFVFLFMATYIVNYTYPWEYRLIASIGVYVVYKMVVEDVKEILKR